MLKRLILTLSAVLLLGGYSAASAADLSTTESELQNVQSEIEEVNEQIRNTPEEQRSPLINEKIQLVMKENKLKAVIKAYEMAQNPAGGEIVFTSTIDRSKVEASKMIPPEYIRYYEAAGEKYGVDWSVLASIHKIETDFSRMKVMTSSAGAIGHMQFMPSTFEVYGVDGNGNGTKSPWEVEDAIYSAANYLSASGYDTDIERAVWAYNHADWYVKEVLEVAESYRMAFAASGVDVLEEGKKLIDKTVYVFGGGRNESDIRQGFFDCSSFIHWAFKQTGQDLGPLTSVTTDTLKNLGEQIDPSEMQPGDLVFFDTYKVDGHVGIYAGNGKFLGAQSTTGVALADMSSGYWKNKFNGRVKRL